MRHIFYVQSNLSRLVCEAIIAHRNIAANEALFILDRATTPPIDIPWITAPQTLRFAVANSFRRIADNRRTKKQISTLFADLAAGDDFQIYVNRMSYHFLEVAEAHPNWQATHLYEEGLAAYYRGLWQHAETGPLPLATRVRLRLLETLSGYSLFRARRTFYTDDYDQVFATSERAFGSFPRRQILDLKAVVARSADPTCYPDLQQDSLICVLPLHNAFSDDQQSADNLVAAFAGVINAFKGRPICLKPHPDIIHNTVFWDRFFDQLSDQTGLDIKASISHDLPLEEVAITRKDVVFCVAVSSIGAYVDTLGTKVVSVAPISLGVDHPRVKEFRRVAKNVVFWENIETQPQGLAHLLDS